MFFCLFVFFFFNLGQDENNNSIPERKQHRSFRSRAVCAISPLNPTCWTLVLAKMLRQCPPCRIRSAGSSSSSSSSKHRIHYAFRRRAATQPEPTKWPPVVPDIAILTTCGFASKAEPMLQSGMLIVSWPQVGLPIASQVGSPGLSWPRSVWFRVTRCESLYADRLACGLGTDLKRRFANRLECGFKPFDEYCCAFAEAYSQFRATTSSRVYRGTTRWGSGTDCGTAAAQRRRRLRLPLFTVP